MTKSAVVKLRDDQVTNAAEAIIARETPYIAHVAIEGAADILFHRWNSDAVDAKAKSAKGSAAKKSDHLETYVYRAPDGSIAVPGEYLRQAVILAAKFQQDPRSPRKSAMDLFKAGIVSLTILASTNAQNWDYEDRRRVMIQRSAITRTRPALRAGWRAEFDLMVQLPEYIDPVLLRRVIDDAGRLIGIGDFRPTYGRFYVAGWELE